MSETDRCHCPPFVDGGVLVRKGCTHHKRPEPKPEPEVVRDPLADEIACAWSDYRSAYGSHGAQQHKAFVAGFMAAQGADLNGPQR